MNKIDYKKSLKEFYVAKVGQPVTVEVPPMNYVAIDGHGDPNTSEEYLDAIQALYPVAYAIKFMCKKELEEDFGVMPLEGLWWTERMSEFNPKDKSNWQWTAMIMQPDVVTGEIYRRAVEQVADKKSPKSLSQLYFKTYVEGRAAQVMYIGPYAEEDTAIAAVHSLIAKQGGVLNGDDKDKRHHEIYLNDPRRTDPAKLKTIIRQPY